MSSKVIKVGHRKVDDVRIGGVYVATYCFDKHRVYVERDGSESFAPFSEILYLLKVPGGDRKLWLKPWERKRVLEALAEVGPVDGSSRPSGQECLVSDNRDGRGGDAS